jgi:hypothetical protein
VLSRLQIEEQSLPGSHHGDRLIPFSVTVMEKGKSDRCGLFCRAYAPSGSRALRSGSDRKRTNAAAG